MTTPLSRLAADLGAAEIDVLVVTSRTNIRYLTGFSGSAGTLVVEGARRTSTEAAATLITDSRYAIQAPEECAAAGEPVEIIVASAMGWAELIARIDAAGRIGLEADHITWSQRDRFADEVAGELVPTSGLIEKLREIKSAAEVEAIRSAAAIADAALQEVRPRLASRPTERQVAALLDSTMRALGADRPGFDTIVASGPNSARPHHRPTDRTITTGDLVIVDFGAELDGYRSDMTRSFSVGPPSGRSAEMLEAVRLAQTAGVAAVAPGVPVPEVDNACRSILVDAGLGEYFTHGTGHGVGLDIHEAPSVNAKGTATLAAGHVITVEPGVYISGFGGVRWEDTIAVTATGAEPLTQADKLETIPL